MPFTDGLTKEVFLWEYRIWIQQGIEKILKKHTHLWEKYNKSEEHIVLEIAGKIQQNSLIVTFIILDTAGN